MKPNFFVLGAPKCGTTSVASWLAQHPNVIMSIPKEPCYFNTDYRLPHRPRSVEEYEAMFNGSDGCLAIGEATTGYLVSRVAVSSIERYSAHAKYIVCLRNPVDMVPSLHAQRLTEGYETVQHLNEAWALQERRYNGEDVPWACPDPKLLLYGQFCSLGSQVQRLLSLVDKDRVLFLFVDDISKDPQAVYSSLLSFLQVSTKHRCHFSVQNTRSLPRFPALAQIFAGARNVKNALGIRYNFGIATQISQFTAVRPKLEVPSQEIRKVLLEYFQDDILRLQDLLQRDLTIWLKI